MGTINYLMTNSLQNIFFYVQHKKETYNNIFIFGWTIPLMILCRFVSWFMKMIWKL